MKQFLMTLLVGFALSSMTHIVGCKANKIHVVHNDNVVTNTVQFKAFNDENYIWEGWSFSTNRVDQ